MPSATTPSCSGTRSIDGDDRADFAPGGFGLGSNDNFPGRDDEDHYSLGIGVVLDTRFQIDATVDFSDAGNEAAARSIAECLADIGLAGASS